VDQLLAFHPFPAQNDHLYFVCTFAQSRRSPLSCYFPARSINMDRRSAASKARRERHDHRNEPRSHDPARTHGERSRTIVTPGESAAQDKPRGPSLAHSSLTPHNSPLPPAPPRQITRHTLPSNFRPNSLKTNDRCTTYSTHFSRRRVCFVGRGFNPAISDAGASLPFAPVHPREFPGSLLTNHQSRITTHAPEALPNLLSSAEPLRIVFRCMIVVLYKRNFFEPSAPCWALLFSGPRAGHRSQPYRAIRREND
jgi:hypothetical protein